jgi:hypothetical protein
MSKPGISPVLELLSRKENLATVLKIVQYTQEIRDEVANRFWDALEIALKKGKPDGLPNLSWSRWPESTADPDGNWGLDVRLASSGPHEQGLKYQISLQPKCFGFGLQWREVPATDFNRLCSHPAVALLQAELIKKRRRGDIEPEANEWGVWWEYWERPPYQDPWLWFATDFGGEWYEQKAAGFWGFVVQTHALVVDANKALAH